MGAREHNSCGSLVRGVLLSPLWKREEQEAVGEAAFHREGEFCCTAPGPRHLLGGLCGEGWGRWSHGSGIASLTLCHLPSGRLPAPAGPATR